MANLKSTETRVDRMQRWAKNNSVIAILIFGAVIVVGVSTTSESINHLLLATHIVDSEALALAERSAKSDLSRDLTRTAWKRIYWARSYVERNRMMLPASDQDFTWNKYYDATEEWNANLMIYLQGLEVYYPHSGKRESLEQDIQTRFGEIHKGLVALRFSGVAKGAAPGELQRPDYAEIRGKIDDLNSALYLFVLNETEPAARKAAAMPAPQDAPRP